MSNDMSDAVVLDATALVSYARWEGPAVGELIYELRDDTGGWLIVPTLALVAALGQLTREERSALDKLLDVPRIEALLLRQGIKDLDYRTAKMVVAAAEDAGVSVDCAHAAILAAQARCHVMTADPAGIDKVLPGYEKILAL